MTNNKKTYDYAKLKYNDKDYPVAVSVCKELWDNSSKNDNKLLSLYGYSLRKNDQSSEFIKIIKNLENKSLIKDKLVVSPLCWCVYDEYIKNYNVDDTENFDNFLKKAQFITDRIKQEPYDKYIYEKNKLDKEIINPFVLTIKKVVSIYNEKTQRRYSRKIYQEIINWLNKLDPLILSEQCFEFEDNKGKERKLASSKEFYYQHLTKALEKIEDYSNCIRIAEIALKEINIFHYRNDIWINLRLNFSKCMIAKNREEAIINFERFAKKENLWFIWYKLSYACLVFGKVDESLLYGSKSIIIEYKYESMVKLFYILGVLWKNKGNDNNAKEFFQAAAYYRYINTWTISEELNYYIEEYKIDIKKKPMIKNIIKICEEYIDLKGSNDYTFGRLKRILKYKGYGFIETEKLDKDVYFKISELKMDINKAEGKIVKYILVQVGDSYIAKNIKEVN